MAQKDLMVRGILRQLFPTLKPIRTPDRPGRNQPCPCQSGIKYKKCCKDITTLVDKIQGLLDAEAAKLENGEPE